MSGTNIGMPEAPEGVISLEVLACTSVAEDSPFRDFLPVHVSVALKIDEWYLVESLESLVYLLRRQSRRYRNGM